MKITLSRIDCFSPDLVSFTPQEIGKQAGFRLSDLRQAVRSTGQRLAQSNPEQRTELLYPVNQWRSGRFQSPSAQVCRRYSQRNQEERRMTVYCENSHDNANRSGAQSGQKKSNVTRSHTDLLPEFAARNHFEDLFSK